MRWPTKLALLLIFATTTGCEDLSLLDSPTPQSPSTPTIPTSLGQGTRQSPLTVADVQECDTLEGDYWVIGYAVGTTHQTMSAATFAASTTYTTNLLLSDDSTAQSTALCIPVQLSTSKIQQALSLAHHSEMHRQAILVHGTYGQYFRTAGLRDVSEGLWLPHLDIGTLTTEPQPWEEADSVLQR